MKKKKIYTKKKVATGQRSLEFMCCRNCLLDDKGFIHIPISKPWGLGESVNDLGFKLFPEQVGHNHVPAHHTNPGRGNGYFGGTTVTVR